MGPLPTYRVGMNNFWRRVTRTTTGTTTVVTPPASTLATGGTNRVVITEIILNGYNANAALTTILLRNTTTTANVALGAGMNPTSGSVSIQTSCWIPMADGEGVDLVVGGALTGSVDVTLVGIFLPGTTPAADKYTGAP